MISEAQKYIFILSFSVTFLMSLMSFLNYRSRKSKELLHLSLFWASLLVMTLTCFIFNGANHHVVALSLIGWIWPLATLRSFLEDMTNKDLFTRWKYIVLGTGAALSVGMATYGFPFPLYTAPFALSVSLIGLWVVLSAYVKTSKNNLTLFHHMAYLFMCAFFVTKFAFPFMRMRHHWLTDMLFVDLLILIGLAASTLSLYMEVLKGRHEAELERLLKERSEKLYGQSKYAELGMMSAGIAHEINNPLAIIQAKISQLLRIHNDPARAQDLAQGLQLIQYTTERIDRTVQGVRMFIRQDEGPSQDIYLKDLADEVLALCGQRMKSNGIEMRIRGLEKLKIAGHKVQLEQVLLNLLNNSFDAISSLPEKWIEISASFTEDTIQIFVKDSGKGIPDEIASKIMDTFFTTKEPGKGTGLGLSLARGIVEKHGGTLRYIRNSPHTTFLLEFPKVEGERVAYIH